MTERPAVKLDGWCSHATWCCLGVGVPTAEFAGVETCEACWRRFRPDTPWPGDAAAACPTSEESR